MSRLSKHSKAKAPVKKVAESVVEASDSVVKNYMAGNSYKLNPIDTLKIVAASSIFGEPTYYRPSGVKKSSPVGIKNMSTLKEYSIFKKTFSGAKTAADVMTIAIDNALEFDFKATLDLALELRTEYYMRLNPSVIFIRATLNKKREAFNKENPGYMKTIGMKIALRPDDLTNQLDYYMYLNGSKKNLPSIVKRTWASRLEEYSRYQLNKYKGKSLIDLVRISHANNEDIDELMRTGTLAVEETEMTWETLRSQGKSWTEILGSIDVPHMALLRNLRGIFTEIKDAKIADEALESLKAGVKKGKQFPFRYFSAYNAVKSDSSVNHKTKILNALEECLELAIENMPKLDGKVMSLCDNSGSAWGALTSEYGTVKVAEIANLSALITANQSDEGWVGIFGDRLKTRRISTVKGLLKQHEESNKQGSSIGGGTENGIWLFWDQAIKNKEHWDTVFIYSDMQAGHGSLYGVNASQYREFIHPRGGSYIDVLALVEKYRKTVNPKVNVFSVQVAGYDNSVLPENLYRGAILGGWTGKEPLYAKAVIDVWDSLESGFEKLKSSVEPKQRKKKSSDVNTDFIGKPMKIGK